MLDAHLSAPTRTCVKTHRCDQTTRRYQLETQQQQNTHKLNGNIFDVKVNLHPRRREERPDRDKELEFSLIADSNKHTRARAK